MTEYKKKLIEVALPLDAINAESAREKSIRHGHPSTLHLWWARRPLAACRAVLFSQLVDDPSGHPDQFPTEEAQDAERARLFTIIENLVKWENSTNETVLEAARAEIRKSCDGNPPPILDPFAGGGSIPLEAQRLGLETYASDLNPVAVLINKALIEIPPRWSGQTPVFPDAAAERTHWNGAEGLAEDVRRYGAWMRDEAEQRIGHHYPTATLPDGGEAKVIAWIWARTVTCPNPACGARMPLASAFWLGKKKGKEAWLKPVIDDGTVRFEIGHEASGPPDPPKTGRGARFNCLVCNNPAEPDYLKAEGMAGRMGAQLMAIVAEGNRRRIYLPADEVHLAAAQVERPADVPDQEVPHDPRNVWCKIYGFERWADLFTNRQLVALTTFSDLVDEARVRAKSDGHTADLGDDDASAYADAIATYLAFSIDRIANECSSINTWVPSASKEHVKNAFGRQAIPMTWDFAESNPFFTSTGSFISSVGRVAETLERLSPTRQVGQVAQRDARSVPPIKACVATDPPYYDNIGYADLADFFYVWARRSLRTVYPDLLATMLTPKASELIASPYRHDGSASAAEKYFEEGFVDVFRTALTTHISTVPMTLFYAFKQSETSSEGTASTGWATMLEGLLAAGWAVTATWPMRTERSIGLKSKDNVLASSVVLACRPRPESAGITDRQGLIRALQNELPGPLRELQKASIAPVDLRQAAIGPGMAVFSRFAKVIESDSEPMRVRTALALINQVLDTILSEQESDFDTATRWAIQWFQQFYGDEGPYGVAEQLATAMNVSVAEMERSGILTSSNGRVRLLGRDEYPDGWDPRKDTRTSIWEATQHLVKRLEDDGELASAKLLDLLGGVGESCRSLTYRLYTICESTRPNLASPYNALAASWTEMQRVATDDKRRMAEPGEQQTLDVG